MARRSKPSALDRGQVPSHAVDLPDGGTRFKQRPIDRLLVVESQAGQRQHQQRRRTAGDQAQHQILSIQSLHHREDPPRCCKASGIRHRMRRLDDVDAATGHVIAITRDHQSGQLAGPIVLHRPGHRCRGLAGADHHQPSARRWRQMRRHAQRRLRGADGSVEHAPQQRAHCGRIAWAHRHLTGIYCPISWLASSSSTRTMAEWSQALPPRAPQALNNSWAAAVLGNDSPTWRALVSARFRSFWCNSMRKPGSKLRLIIRSPCTSSTRDDAKPPISAWRTLPGSAPIFDANSNASPTASMVSAPMIWFATLQVWPSPLPPTRVMFLPMSSNSGLTLPKALSGPPTMIVRLAARAPTSPPDTGASRYWQPSASMRTANPLVSTGEMELMSITILPGDRPAAMPSASNRAAATFGVSGTMVMMKSARCATTWPEGHWIAPCASSACGAGL